MSLSEEHIEYIERSILCWLATISADHEPNVSPKEIFTNFGTDRIIVANIASPQTVKNIEINERVCISFIDILVQKGYKVKGKARIVSSEDPEFPKMNEILLQMTKGAYPYSTITEISVDKIKAIIAPKYILYPHTTEAEQIESARNAYGLPA